MGDVTIIMTYDSLLIFRGLIVFPVCLLLLLMSHAM